MFKLGAKSVARLAGVHPDLRRVVELAISVSKIDFTVLEGVRSAGRQRQLVASGASRTMDSRHITGHAVDLAAYVDGAVRWDFGYYYQIANAMRDAAIKLDTPIIWGGCWGQTLNKIDDTREAVAEYLNTGRPFLDGPHFELCRKAYQ